MRHIPDDELHAYLDQALSRSQAIEIERHLARCPTCQSRRDEAAALRDRTTAILARLGSPPSVVAPPFEELRARHAAGVARRAQWMRRAAVAAGVAGLALGLTVWRRPAVHEAALAAPPVAAAPSASPIVPDSAPLASPTGPVATAVPAAAPRRPETPRLVQAGAGTGESSFFVANAVETDPPATAARPLAESAPDLPTDLRVEDVDVKASPVSSEPGLAGLWRTVPVEAGEAEAAGLPIVPGLAVVRLRMQPGATGSRGGRGGSAARVRGDRPDHRGACHAGGRHRCPGRGNRLHQRPRDLHHPAGRPHGRRHGPGRGGHGPAAAGERAPPLLSGPASGRRRAGPQSRGRPVGACSGGVRCCGLSASGDRTRDTLGAAPSHHPATRCRGPAWRGGRRGATARAGCS
ncbi:MAG: zf-HC2 domain-containing protein [Gemmatimonadetes bacterium]|nr:zf-HC2 domain-containing protein [Gemmatimonadota bacterium]